MLGPKKNQKSRVYSKWSWRSLHVRGANPESKFSTRVNNLGKHSKKTYHFRTKKNGCGYQILDNLVAQS